MSRAFPAVMRRCLKAYRGSKQALAKEVGIAPSTLSHLVAGNLTPSVELCLRLAGACGVSASLILTAAGRREMVPILETIYGPATGRQVADVVWTPDELELLAKLRLVKPRSRRALHTLIDAAAFANGLLELPPGHTARRLVMTPESKRPELRLKT